MRLARFATVRGRLLALLVAIAFPIAILTAITAYTTYRTVTAGVAVTQLRTADDYAVRARVWYRGALRSLLTGGTALVGSGATAEECSRGAMSVLGQVPGYGAIHIRSRSDLTCTASMESAIGANELAQAIETLKAKPAVQIWGGVERVQVRYDQISFAGKPYLAVYAGSDGNDQPLREGLLLIDADVLDRVFDLGESEPGLSVALVSRAGGVIALRKENQDATSWLPIREIIPEVRDRWQAESRAGEMRTYAARVVAEQDVYVIASFDDGLGRAARVQFLVLLIAPLLTLALLCLVYLRAIDRHCVGWLRGIESAARARATQPSARAVIAPDMPRDIRSVAEAFNTMIEEQEVRQRRLQSTLDDNRFLVRELHHRVKNSLQVVQSYIGLTKRDYRGEARLALADAECRVHVLSAAYRFTLADGEMQPVRVDLFIDDVVTMISNLLRGRDQWITSAIETRASLPVDRIIPLGFLIVDVVSRALRSTDAVTIRITLRDIDETTLEVAMAADREIVHTAPPKLFAGLVAQIEAVQSESPEGRSLGAWRLGHV
jgi:two-component sensor histidine kinase